MFAEKERLLSLLFALGLLVGHLIYWTFFDTLTVVMLNVVCFISLLVHIYLY